MEVHHVSWQELREYCKQLLMKVGLAGEQAFVAADNLVDADLCGVESHGVSRMTIYMKRLDTKVVSAEFQVKTEQEYAGSLAIDGCNSMGICVGAHAMQRCIDKARESGVCFAAVKHSNHYGMAAYYVRMAAEQGMIGITGTNAPPNIAPWGSSQAYVGTNPIALAAPTGTVPMLLDMAPSTVAMGKVILAAKLGNSIPEGWALTKEGEPTTDPKLGMEGTVVPIGGPKGYGLSLFMDVLSGILSGAQFGPHLNNMWKDFEHPQDVGHFFMAVDISKFTPLPVFCSRMDEMISEIKSLPRKEGAGEIMVPGEPEFRRKEERKRSGIPLSGVVYEELRALSEKYRVPFTI